MVQVVKDNLDKITILLSRITYLKNYILTVEMKLNQKTENHVRIYIIVYIISDNGTLVKINE